jgi:pyridoxamine 5'-phosphate oxidase
MPNADANPANLLEDWLAAATSVDPNWANAMVLATASAEGAPSARVVLFKGWSGERLTFYTNYESRKARELEDNPRAAAVFYWRCIDRQVRIEGPVEMLSERESDAYFSTRPWRSQIAALASAQSRPLASRKELTQVYAQLAARYDGTPPSRPRHWGGYGLRPVSYEFWVLGPDRLHERTLYVRDGTGWRQELLAP